MVYARLTCPVCFKELDTAPYMEALICPRRCKFVLDNSEIVTYKTEVVIQARIKAKTSGRFES